jgi:carbon monoxide dehydrogenase subunit G
MSASSSNEKIFAFLSDFTHFGDLLPAEKVKNWQATEDTCRFTVDGLGEIGLRIVKKEAYSLVQFAGNGKVPFDFYLMVHLEGKDENHTDVYLSAEAKLNPMLKMIASGPVQKFLDTLVQAIAAHKY